LQNISLESVYKLPWKVEEIEESICMIKDGYVKHQLITPSPSLNVYDSFLYSYPIPFTFSQLPLFTSQLDGLKFLTLSIHFLHLDHFIWTSTKEGEVEADNIVLIGKREKKKGKIVDESKEDVECNVTHQFSICEVDAKYPFEVCLCFFFYYLEKKLFIIFLLISSLYKKKII
jgi:hypothetical protein